MKKCTQKTWFTAIFSDFIHVHGLYKVTKNRLRSEKAVKSIIIKKALVNSVFFVNSALSMIFLIFLKYEIIYPNTWLTAVHGTVDVQTLCLTIGIKSSSTPL